MDDSKVDVDDTSVLSSKTIDFLTPAQRKHYESNKSASTLASVGPSQTAAAASSISEAMSMEGVEEYKEPSALG